MFGARFGTAGIAGQPAQPAFSQQNVFGVGARRGADFSRLHTEMPRMPTAEYVLGAVPPDPLQQDQAKGPAVTVEPTRPWLGAATAAARQDLKRALPQAQRESVQNLEAKKRWKRAEDQQREAFVHDFRNWLLGVGKPEDHRRAGTERGVGKMPSRHPTILAYVDKLVDREARYNAEIAKMQARGPGVGRNGGEADATDALLYFKYVVRQCPPDPADFWFLDAGDGPDAAVNPPTTYHADSSQVPNLGSDLSAGGGIAEQAQAQTLQAAAQKKAQDATEARDNAEAALSADPDNAALRAQFQEAVRTQRSAEALEWTANTAPLKTAVQTALAQGTPLRLRRKKKQQQRT